MQTFNIMFVFTMHYILNFYILTNLLQNGFCQLGGPAEINIKSIEHCPEPEQYKYKVNVQRHKVNRTHEAFDGNSDLGIPLDDQTGIYINVAKKASDGYKPNAFEFRESNACAFFSRFIGKGFTDMLINIGEPPTCPVKAGSYVLKNFLIDYREIPSSLPYGDFRANVYMVRDEEKVVCIQFFVTTKPRGFKP